MFTSDPQVTGISPIGLPKLIYVVDPNVPVFVQTALTAVWCRDETGGDALGDDELVVWMGTMNTLPKWQDIEDVEDQFGVYTTDINVNNRKRPRKLMSSLRMSLDTTDVATVVVRAIEDDDFDWDHVVVASVSAIVAAAGTVAGGGAPLAVAAAGAVAGGGSFLGALAALPGPDDEIGQSAWTFNAADVASSGLFAHDSIVGLPNATPELFDSTMPRGTFDPAHDTPGTIERVSLNGAGKYVLYFSTSLSDESCAERTCDGSALRVEEMSRGTLAALWPGRRSRCVSPTRLDEHLVSGHERDLQHEVKVVRRVLRERVDLAWFDDQHVAGA